MAHISCVTFEKPFNLSHLLRRIMMTTSKHCWAGSMRYCVEGTREMAGTKQIRDIISFAPTAPLAKNNLEFACTKLSREHK